MQDNDPTDSTDTIVGEMIITSSSDEHILRVDLQLSDNSSQKAQEVFHGLAILATVDAQLAIQDMKLESLLAKRRHKK